MLYFNETDLLVRIQLSICKYAELANAYSNNLKYGIKCCDSNLNKLLLLNGYINILKNYKPNSSNNCLTENEVQIISDNISKLTGLCFQPINFEYETETEIIIPPDLNSYLLNDSGDYILQSDNFRIIIL